MEQMATVAFTSPAGPGAEAESGFAGGAVNNPAEMAIIATLSFDDLMQAVEDCMRKPMSVRFKLHHLAGQISVNQIVLQLKKLSQRFAKMKLKITDKKQRADEGSESLTQDIRLMVLLKRATASFEIAEYVLKVLSRNFDYGQVRARVSITSGSNSSLKIRATEVVARAPMSIWLNLPQRLAYFGIFCPISYVLAFKTDPDGSFIIEFNHVGSPSGVRRGAFLNAEDEKDRRQNKRRAGAKASWKEKWIAALSKAKIERSNDTAVATPPSASAGNGVGLNHAGGTGLGLDGNPALQSLTAPIAMMGNDLQRFSQRAMAVANKAIEDVNSVALSRGQFSLGGVFGTVASASAPATPTTASTSTKQVAGSPLTKQHPSVSVIASEVSAVSVNSTESSPTAVSGGVEASIRSRTETVTTDGGSSIAGTPPQISKIHAEYSKAVAFRTPTTEFQSGKAAVDTSSSKKSKPPVLRSYIRRRRLEHTLKQAPKDMDVAEVLSIVVTRPKITMVTEKAMALRAGAELFTFSLGKSSVAGVDGSKKQVNIEDVVYETHVKSRRKGTRVVKQGEYLQ